MSAIETLFYTIRGDANLFLTGRVCFLNARYHSALQDAGDTDFTFSQHFKPYAQDLQAKGFDVFPDIPDGRGGYDCVFVLVPKNMVEARYLMARGMALLKSGGVFVCAADNLAGGKRLVRMMQDFGFDDVCSEVRNKARCVWARMVDVEEGVVEGALIKGAVQSVLGGAYQSQPGVFGWNKIDRGSELLTRYLPHNLSGRGADFGCGYGYLSDFLVNNCKDISSLHCLDADYRAVELCRCNLADTGCDVSFLWCDLTVEKPDMKPLDFIVMNPPFHEGKRLDFSIGKNFIETAHSVLRKNGRLFMVSNSHLAYEYILEPLFSDVQKHHEEQGFKVFEAVK